MENPLGQQLSLDHVIGLSILLDQRHFYEDNSVIYTLKKLHFQYFLKYFMKAMSPPQQSMVPFYPHFFLFILKITMNITDVI